MDDLGIAGSNLVRNSTMGEYFKCECSHCGQPIEYPSEGSGQSVACPSCCGPVTLWSPNSPPTSGSTAIQSGNPDQMPPMIPQVRFPLASTNSPNNPPPPPPEITVAMKQLYSRLTELTDKTISKRLPRGDTYLHRAIEHRMVRAIPSLLLKPELFLRQNENGDTPLHIAARSGKFDQIPTKCLTKETLTVWNNYGYTPLHIVAQVGELYRIPTDFLTSELLSLTTKNDSAETVLHYIAQTDMLYLVPEGCLTPAGWNAKNGLGLTPSECLKKKRELFEARCRTNPKLLTPATDKQIAKLRYFGCACDEGTTYLQASAALDKCVTEFVDANEAYYNRPPTEEQLENIRQLNEESIRIDGEPAYDLEQLTYAEAKRIIQEDQWAQRKAEEEETMEKFSNPPSKAQLAWLKESGIKLDSSANVTEWELECIIDLEKSLPSEGDLSFFKQHGVISFEGDGFGACLFADLIRSFGGSAQDHNRANINYGPPCQAALRDPVFHKPTLTYNDVEHCVEFTWPKSKIKEWLRS